MKLENLELIFTVVVLFWSGLVAAILLLKVNSLPLGEFLYLACLENLPFQFLRSVANEKEDVFGVVEQMLKLVVRDL